MANEIGGMMYLMSANGSIPTLKLPTVWIFKVVPPDLKDKVELWGAYYKEGDKGVAFFEKDDKWRFIQSVDRNLTDKELAAVFGVEVK